MKKTRHTKGSDILDDLRAHEKQLLLNGHNVIFKGRVADWPEVHGKIEKEYVLVWETRP